MLSRLLFFTVFDRECSRFIKPQYLLIPLPSSIPTPNIDIMLRYLHTSLDKLKHIIILLGPCSSQ